MSKFNVTIEKIKNVTNHPNADRLDLVTLTDKSFQLVTQKGQFKSKDKVVYFPVDSVLPQPLIEKMGLTYLHGANKNRVKTVKLRGAISQGIVAKATDFKFGKLKTGTDVTEKLGIEKFEAVEVRTGKHTQLKSLPDGVFYYDLENAQNFPDVIEALSKVDVCVEEKIEGTHFVFSYLPDTDEFEVCSRRKTVTVESVTFYEDNPYWKVAIDKGYLDYARSISTQLKIEGFEHNRLTLRGELIGNGIQNNIYNLSEYDVYFFEMELDSKPVDRTMFYTYMYDFNLKTAPCIFAGGKLKSYTNGLGLDEMSTGYSLLNPKQLREGIVIRPYKEFDIPGFGRAIIKQRSPEYLANSDL